MTTLEDRVKKLESDLKVVASVTAAVVDDNLRACLVLQELSKGGYLPDLPWDLATRLVDLHYAKQVQAHGGVKEGTPIEVKIAELEVQVQSLREAFLKKANEQQIG